MSVPRLSHCVLLMTVLIPILAISPVLAQDAPSGQAAQQKALSCKTKPRYCKELKTCEEACFYLQRCNVSRLDRDKDGIPCEKLCKKTACKASG